MNYCRLCREPMKEKAMACTPCWHKYTKLIKRGWLPVEDELFQQIKATFICGDTADVLI